MSTNRDTDDHCEILSVSVILDAKICLIEDIRFHGTAKQVPPQATPIHEEYVLEVD